MSTEASSTQSPTQSPAYSRSLHLINILLAFFALPLTHAWSLFKIWGWHGQELLGLPALTFAQCVSVNILLGWPLLSLYAWLTIKLGSLNRLEAIAHTFTLMFIGPFMVLGAYVYYLLLT